MAKGDMNTGGGSAARDEQRRPLVVCLDGTLIATDLLQEAFIQVLRQRPLHVIRLLPSLCKGNAVFRQQIADVAEIEPQALPWRPGILRILRTERARGRSIWLATTANQGHVQRIAEHLGFVDRVLSCATADGNRGQYKRELIETAVDDDGYDYIGHSSRDVPALAGAEQAWVTGPGANRLQRWGNDNGYSFEFLDNHAEEQMTGGQALMKLLRPHQWLKNLLIFVPLIAAHGWTDTGTLTASMLAFVAFCLAASASYILNDLIDVPFDRRHPRKRYRPLAAGILGHRPVLQLYGVMAVTACLLAITVSWNLFALVVGYSLLTLAYSTYFKRYSIVDVLVLTLLYSLRLVAGAIAAGVALSYWLLAFTLFMFFGLAVMKRSNELVADTGGAAQGRPYTGGDEKVLMPLGIASSIASVVVLALYMNSSTVQMLYSEPRWLWPVIPIILVWQFGLWLSTSRGVMHDDPMVFALRFPATYWCVSGSLALFLLAL